jgi:hypothetical protein
MRPKLQPSRSQAELGGNFQTAPWKMREPSRQEKILAGFYSHIIMLGLTNNLTSLPCFATIK